MKNVKKVKPVLQMEVTECGAASLCMILDYYGKSVTMEQLRLECGVSRNGVNAKNIARAAMLHGLKPRALKVGIHAARGLKFPAIIHWNMDHFVVLCGFTKKGAVIADPASGLRQIPEDEFSNNFTGIALEFTPTESFEKNRTLKNKNDYIKSCLKSFAPVMFIFLICEFCVLASGGVLPFLSSVYINRVLLDGKIQQLSFVTAVLLACLLLAFLGGVIRVSTINRVVKQLNAKLNLGFFEHILKLPIEFFLQRNSGELAMRQGEAMNTGRLIVSMLPFIFTSMLQVLVYLGLLFFMNLKIAAIGVTMVVVNFIAAVLASKRYREKVMRSDRERAMLQGLISQTIDAMETIKSCGCEDAVFERLISAGSISINARTEIEKTSVLTNTVFTFLNTFSSALVIVAGIWEILFSSLTTGSLIALQGVMVAMLAPVGSAMNMGFQIQQLSGITHRTNDVMRYMEDTKFAEEEQKELTELDSDITLEDITFGYSPLDTPILQNFDLHIKKGGSLAIIGGSGSGKSTVAKLIAGLFCEKDGKIYFGSRERKEIRRDDFYSETAVVTQNIRLFEGTVLDNITMFDHTIPYDDVVAAAKIACIHEGIIARPSGYREWVSENGRNFSGGQRQRIEIARAIVKKPRLLIMDEATSALDADTEMNIMKAVSDMGITTIVVAHRLSAIRYCDSIMVMKNGEITEYGTHCDLMALNGEYAALQKEGDAE
ncbi:MAG: ATP-binding cassette domain-containing protein [Butyricicoccus pullicaecorum]|nr:ATP-binding cassette domain-containing protein [Butyricicoccus pullicaecorum]